MLGVAKQLGGGVRVSSRLGTGTTVQIYLPRAIDAVEAPAELAVPSDAPRRLPGLTVLVVDDDSDVREAAAGLLQALGCEVLQADSGPDAIDLIASGTAVDVALVDYAMPGMNGAETSVALRTHRPTLQVVIATGFAGHGELP